MHRLFLIDLRATSSRRCSNGGETISCIFMILGIIFLTGCSSQPYLCQNVMFPQNTHFLEGGWKYAATVCETRIRSIFFEPRDGTLLSISVQIADGNVILRRDIFFEGEDRLSLNSHWENEEQLVIHVGKDPKSSESNVSSDRIADVYLAVPQL